VSEVLNTEVIRKMRRDELEERLTDRRVAFDADDSDNDLRNALMNHEAAQACPYWG
jgi:hypothetical protein